MTGNWPRPLSAGAGSTSSFRLTSYLGNRSGDHPNGTSLVEAARRLPRCNGLDFKSRALGDGGDLDAGAGGERRAEGAGVGVVHGVQSPKNAGATLA